MTHLSLSKRAARQYVLGRQGLWPGRRWAGKAGTAQALREVEMVQMDPLNIVARSHELALLSRVDDYSSAHLDELMYGDRCFFDYGGTIFICPMEELPYWRVNMRYKAVETRWTTFAAQNPTLLKEVKAELRRRGPLGNRDFTGRARVTSYRSGKDSGLALYYLWLTGELMTHHRLRFERVYDFRRHVAPPALDYVAGVEEAEAFFVRKSIAFRGLSRLRSFGWLLERRVSPEEVIRWRDELLATREIVPVEVEGEPEPHYAPAADVPILEAIQAGRIPEAWQPLGTTTLEEVSFLAPLDIVSARGRALKLFDFDYVWEVYKPVEQRRWGYYTLPILYGDELVARIDPKLNREAGTLVVNGFWLENAKTGRDPAFVEALGRGLARLARFTGAHRLDLSPVKPPALRKRLQQIASSLS